jgi:hypothetical protein
MPGCWPGGTLGAGLAVTPGVKRLPPVGLTPFSVGDGGAALGGDVVVVVVVVDVDGPWLLLPHAVANPPNAISAAPAATAILNRLSLTVITVLVLFISQLFRCTPGGSVGAGGALMSGVKRLPPVGLISFSVGDGGVALVGDVVVVVVVVVVEEGAWPPLFPQPAVKTPIAIRRPPPAVAIKRRASTLELISVHN